MQAVALRGVGGVPSSSLPQRMIWLVELWLSSLCVKTIEIRMSSSAGIRMQQPRMVMAGSSFPSLKKLSLSHCQLLWRVGELP